ARGTPGRAQKAGRGRPSVGPGIRGTTPGQAGPRPRRRGATPRVYLLVAVSAPAALMVAAVLAVLPIVLDLIHGRLVPRVLAGDAGRVPATGLEVGVMEIVFLLHLLVGGLGALVGTLSGRIALFLLVVGQRRRAIDAGHLVRGHPALAESHHGNSGE